MSYVISRRASGEYVKIAGGKGSWATLLKNATKFLTIERADNFLQHNFSGVFPGIGTSEVMILNIDNLTEVYYVDNTTFTEEQARQSLNEMIAFYNEIVENTNKFLPLPNYFANVVSQYDKETLDILHKMEFKNENVVNGYKRYKQMQDVRQRRREAKDALEYASLILSSGLLACLERLKTDIAKLKESEETRTYKPRVLTEMFDDSEE